MQNPTYLSADQTEIRIDVDGSTSYVLTEVSNPTLWAEVMAETYGPIQPYTPDADDGPDTPRRSVTRMQAQLAMLEAGILDMVETLIDSLDRATQIAWQEAGTIYRDSPLLNALLTSVTWPDGTPLTQADLDELFDAAERIDL